MTLLLTADSARSRADLRRNSRARRGREAEGGARLGTSRIMRHSGRNACSHEVSKRAERYGLRAELRTFSDLKRVRACGLVPIRSAVTLRANEDGGAAGFTGVATCGSVWACPVCAAKVARHRSEELGEALANADKEGLSVSMVTLTMRHRAGQRLADLWDGLSYAWRCVASGKAWKEDRAAVGLEGYARAVEVTHGANGWHVHIHLVLVSEIAPDLRFISRLFGRWKRGLNRLGFDSVEDSGGLDFQVARRGDGAALGRYAAKLGFSGLANEATLGGFKHARGENRTPFQILADIISEGDYDDLTIWWEYESASRGRRALTYSRGFRNRFGMEEEKTDEEIAAESRGDTDLLSFDAPIWRKRVAPYAAEILDTCEAGGLPAVVELLHSLEIPFEVLAPPD